MQILIPRFTSLRSKLIACFLALTLIPFATIGIYGYLMTHNALRQQAIERSIHQVHLQAEHIVGALRQVHGDALYLRGLRSLTMLRQQTEPEQRALWEQEVAQDLLVLASARPMYSALRLIDLEGHEYVTVQARDAQVSLVDETENRRDALFFREAVRLAPGGVYISPFQTQASSGFPHANYAVRLDDGVLVIDLHAGWLLRSLPGNPGADTWALIDQDGRFLVYPDGFDPQTVATDVPRMLGGAAGNFETDSSVYVFDTIFPAAGDAAANAPQSFWVLFCRTPRNVLYASVTDLYRLGAAFVIGGLLVTAALAAIINRILIVPLARLEAMTADFGREGVPPQPPRRPSSDELGKLTCTFIDMARELDGKRQQEHRLIERLIHAQEEERKIVAYDLHDGLIQQLVGARFYLTNSRDEWSENGSNARASIQRGCDALSEAIVEGRRIIEGLRPAALDDLGLASTIEELARTTASAAGWKLTLEIEPLPCEPETAVAVTLYRIAQEALNNARRHAHAEHVRVSLHNGAGIFLSVEDDGSGFDLVSVTRDGHGLGISTMQERATLIEGRCMITSQPDGGTRVEVIVPRSLPVRHEESILNGSTV